VACSHDPSPEFVLILYLKVAILVPSERYFYSSVVPCVIKHILLIALASRFFGQQPTEESDLPRGSAHACNFMSCNLVVHFHVLGFHALHSSTSPKYIQVDPIVVATSTSMKVIFCLRWFVLSLSVLAVYITVRIIPGLSRLEWAAGRAQSRPPILLVLRGSHSGRERRSCSKCVKTVAKPRRVSVFESPLVSKTLPKIHLRYHYICVRLKTDR